MSEVFIPTRYLNWKITGCVNPLEDQYFKFEDVEQVEGIRDYVARSRKSSKEYWGMDNNDVIEKKPKRND